MLETSDSSSKQLWQDLYKKGVQHNVSNMIKFPGAAKIFFLGVFPHKETYAFCYTYGLIIYYDSSVESKGLPFQKGHTTRQFYCHYIAMYTYVCGIRSSLYPWDISAGH